MRTIMTLLAAAMVCFWGIFEYARWKTYGEWWAEDDDDDAQYLEDMELE